jgi:hypothetical protein
LVQLVLGLRDLSLAVPRHLTTNGLSERFPGMVQESLK